MRHLTFIGLPLLAAALLISPAAYAAATIAIVNTDGAGEGFNDPTPVAPVGGNSGTTLGQQRLIAFQYAASIWGEALTSNVEIRIQASFDPLPCTATTATLGAAGTIQIVADFPGAPNTGTWYPVALANSLAGFDLIPGDPGTAADDIRAFFNSDLDNATCLGNIGWYYGLDTNHGNNSNLVTVLLHEFGHGLGFASYVDESKGQYIGPPFFPDIYSSNIFDTTVGKTWNQMTQTQRKASAVNVRHLVWNGAAATAAASKTLSVGSPLMTVTSPATIAGDYRVGIATFGDALTARGLTGTVALVNDGTGVVTDGCEGILNGVAGQIALIDRGTCTFPVKVKNAQNAGAIGVIVADNTEGEPSPGMSGSDPSISIPSVRISLADGNTLKSQLATGVTAKLYLDRSLRSGADSSGRVFLWATNPIQPGSSISHWDALAFPNLLMEPFLSADLEHALDLTVPLLKDLGWRTGK